MNFKSILDWAVRIIAAMILLQTLFFKFTGAEESRYIFTQLGVEPWGRIFSGVMELTSSILLIIPATALYGALLSLGIMGGAIAAHLLILGIEVNNDGGLLFALAMIVSVCCIITLFFRKNQIAEFLAKKAD